jgi:hypothetical protein
MTMVLKTKVTSKERITIIGEIQVILDGWWVNDYLDD